ncbi:hypothetical protein [Streptomyces flaveolus]|uniref:hypothetical protein n=1 Tax=Streptomyces flaveolus TaxID=67297 RepID=UPI0033C5F183
MFRRRRWWVPVLDTGDAVEHSAEQRDGLVRIFLHSVPGWTLPVGSAVAGL